jgi:hypothetical protein
VVGSLGVGGSDLVVEVGNGSLRRRGDRPQPTSLVGPSLVMSEENAEPK